MNRRSAGLSGCLSRHPPGWLYFLGEEGRSLPDTTDAVQGDLQPPTEPGGWAIAASCRGGWTDRWPESEGPRTTELARNGVLKPKNPCRPARRALGSRANPRRPRARGPPPETGLKTFRRFPGLCPNGVTGCTGRRGCVSPSRYAPRHATSMNGAPTTGAMTDDSRGGAPALGIGCSEYRPVACSGSA